MESSNVSAQTVVTVLRGLLLAFAASQRADLGKISAALEALAGEADIDPVARTMLVDLAGGAATMHRMLLGGSGH